MSKIRWKFFSWLLKRVDSQVGRGLSSHAPSPPAPLPDSSREMRASCPKQVSWWREVSMSSLEAHLWKANYTSIKRKEKKNTAHCTTPYLWHRGTGETSGTETTHRGNLGGNKSALCLGCIDGFMTMNLSKLLELYVMSVNHAPISKTKQRHLSPAREPAHCHGISSPFMWSIGTSRASELVLSLLPSSVFIPPVFLFLLSSLFSGKVPLICNLTCGLAQTPVGVAWLLTKKDKGPLPTEFHPNVFILQIKKNWKGLPYRIHAPCS